MSDNNGIYLGEGNKFEYFQNHQSLSHQILRQKAQTDGKKVLFIDN